MKNKKGILAILGTILLIIFLNKGITVHAQQIEPEGWIVYNKIIKEYGDFQYYVQESTGRAFITGYLGNAGEIIIPDSLDGIIVEGIYDMHRKIPIKSLTLGKHFGEMYALGKCTASEFGIEELETIKVSKKNKYYKTYKGMLFSKDKKKLYYCPNSIKKEEVIIPGGVVVVSEGAFNGNLTIKKIVFSKKTKIKTLDNCFNNMAALEEVVLAKNTKVISSCFFSCPRLQSIIFKKGLKKIYNSFCFLDKLKSIELPTSLEIIGMSEEAAFVGCPLLKEVYIPQNIRYISGGSFDKGTVIKCPGYIKKGVLPGDDSSYYSTLTINGETVIIDRLRKIALSDKITQLNRGTKKQISLLATYEEVIFDEELIYTENLLKGVIDPRSINTELITFKSEHPEIIEVTDSGELIAISKGTSRITVKIGTNKKLKLQFIIRVK